MEQYKEDFIAFMVEADALRFGDFALKSGRRSPFFVNTGMYVTGAQLSRLGEFYARAIERSFGLEFDVIFGPAYKGIPLAVITAEAIGRLFRRDVRYTSNRKEIKDHGDTGILLGSKLSDGDRVLIVEDVTTSGLSIAETVPILKAQANVTIAGLMVSLNRQEKGRDTEKSALEEISETYGFPADAIVTMREAVEYLYGREIGGRVVLTPEIKESIDAYYAAYGART